MNTRMRAAATVAALMLLGWAAEGQATVTQVEATPGSASIPAVPGASVAITWRVTTTPDAAGGNGGGGSRVASAGGTFRAETVNGTVIGTSPAMLDGLAQGPVGQPGIATLTEMLVVPPAVLQQAATLGISRIVYQRSFEDPSRQGGGGNVGSVTLNLIVALQVDVDPAIANAAVGQASTVALTWRVSSAASAGAAVSSPRGEFRAGGPTGQILGVQDRPLQAEARASGGGFMSILPETLELPAQVLMRAEQLGVRRIAYLRSFSSGSSPAGSAAAMLNLAGPLSGAFGLTGLTLRFGDGGAQAVVAAGSRFFAFAEVNHTGTGRFEAQWEVAEPSSTRGAPVFRPLNLVRRQLTGSSATRLRSPELPTANDGVYLVRLRITRPEAAFELPMLRYFVNPARETAPDPLPIAATGPAAGATHGPGTRFAWEPLPGAATYRVEFHERSPAPAMQEDGAAEATALLSVVGDAARPHSGIALDSGTTATELSPLALSHLVPGRTWWWRVLAYDDAGRLVGMSEPRRLYVPETAGEP